MQAPQWDEAAADPRVKAILTGIIDLMDAVFPDRILGIYLLGSFAEGTTVTLSDIDLIILFRGILSIDEGEIFARVVEACGLLCPIRLDITAYSEAMFRAEDVRLKLGSVCIAGEDVRARLPLPTPEEHARYITNWANFFVCRLHDRQRLSLPLTYPESVDAFYSYARVRIPEWYPPETVSGTKELVATVCWVATALLSLMRGAAGYVATKGEAVRRYEEMEDGEWGAYVATVYAHCRGAWRYEVPAGAHEREQLRALCAQALPFFNHYLETYAAYLSEQMALDDPFQRQWAEERWGELMREA
jgi:hypothetical protein